MIFPPRTITLTAYGLHPPRNIQKARRRLYNKLGKTPDETVDWEAAAEYFKDLL